MTWGGFEDLQSKSLLALLPRASTWKFFDFFKTPSYRLSLAYVTDVNALRADVNALRADANALRADVNALRADVNALRADVNALRADVNALRADVCPRMSKVSKVPNMVPIWSKVSNFVTSEGKCERVNRCDEVAHGTTAPVLPAGVSHK